MYGFYSEYRPLGEGHQYISGYEEPNYKTTYNQTYYVSDNGANFYHGTSYYSLDSFITYGNTYNASQGENYINYRNNSPGNLISYVSHYNVYTGEQSVQSYNNGYYYTVNRSGYAGGSYNYYGGNYGGYYGYYSSYYYGYTGYYNNYGYGTGYYVPAGYGYYGYSGYYAGAGYYGYSGYYAYGGYYTAQ